MKRYPGPRSFTGDDRHLFFGRSREQEELFRLIVLNELVVLFGESGTGKTSLLQAGVCPALEERQYKPVFIRLNNTAEAPELQVCRQLKEGGFLPADMPEDRTLWEYFSRFWYVDLGEVFTPVFIFDQFEEVFTLYKPEQRRAFLRQFADVANRRAPAGSAPEAAQAPRAKFVFSIRSDFLYLLDELSAGIPSILRCRFQLRLLGREQAADAITRPADVEGNYDSPQFSYSPAALSGILEALGRHETEGRLALDQPTPELEIAAFQLQLVCRQLEASIIQQKRPAGFTIEPHFYGGRAGIRNIINEFYNTVIEKVPPSEREAAERLLARGLIRNGRRIMMEESAMREEYGLSQATLALLHEERLLKREARKGELYYEISHDTLVKPVLERFKKIEEAERERKAREEEERLQREREKIRRARLRNVIIGIVALALLGFAFWRNSAALKAQHASEALEAKAAAEQQRAAEAKTSADEATALAEQAKLEAQEAQASAESAQARAALAEEEVEEKTRALAQKLLKEAPENIYELQYELALENVRDAISLGQEKPKVVQIALELAFWYGESGHIQLAAGLLDSAALLVNNTSVPGFLEGLPQDTAEARQKLRDAIRLFDEEVFKSLWIRYYPVMTEVKGGSFQMGSEEGFNETPHPASVSDFHIAKYETTWWQYGLFCQATGKRYEAPDWGTDGDNPAINVGWYGAVEYCNWLSGQLGHEEAVKKDHEKFNLNLKSNGFRLPTETEWEYAARGGIQKSPYAYAGSDDVDEVAWNTFNSGGRTHSFGEKKPNALGIYDMSGNVWEWCWDWYDDYMDDPPLNYKGPSRGFRRVLRGGAWCYRPLQSLCSYRYLDFPDYKYYGYGFRIARTDGQ